MDNTQWAQGLGFMKEAIGEDQLLVPTTTTTTTTTTTNTETRAAVPISQRVAERKARPPQKGLALHCPRCNSTNTKFCYYNNYSLTQPRYFCKACRRYWTEGGSIRNVPVGGGSRKNNRRSNSAPRSSSNIKNLPPQIPPSASLPTTTTTSQPFNQVHDLNLAYPNHNHNFLNMELSGMELLGSSGITTGGLGPLMPMHMPMAMPPPEEGSGGTGIMLHADGPFDQFDGVNMQEGGRRLLFPFGDLKQEQHRGHGGEQPMFWNGMMGSAGAGSW